MKKIKYLTIATLFLGTTAFGQGLADAVRLSNYQIQGTARSAAMGNAIGAVGGDFTSLSVNPAGIGIYQTSEFTFTPTFGFPKAETTIDNRSFSDNDFKLTFDQLGYVGSVKINESSSSIVRFNYGIGFNKLADFNQSFAGSYGNSPFSFLDGIADYASNERLSNNYLDRDFRNIDFRDWHAKLAWETYLIDPATDDLGQIIDGEYVNILYEGETVDQNKTWERSGRINEYLFSAGLNFNHKFYLGATLGLHDVFYRQESFYSEQFSDDSFRFTDYYKVTGTGYVFKVGAIIKPVSSVRLGLAFHTPTYYVLDEENALAMRSYLQESHYAEGINLYEYDFYTPMRTILSGAFVVNKAAILSFDAEYLDYTAMRFRNGSGGDSMSDLNADIDEAFDNTFNYRLGAEFRVAPSFSLLCGYESYGNPFKNNMNWNEETQTDNISSFSLGFGYSVKNFYIDTAFKQYLGKNNLVDPQPNYTSVPVEYTNNELKFTLGFRF